jgi:hypothetical protein
MSISQEAFMKSQRTSYLFAIALCTLALSACAEFKSSKRLDMASFGENTSAMVSDIKKGLAIKRPILTQSYLQGELLNQYQKQRDDVGRVLGGIVMYSTQVVNLSRSMLPEKEQAKELARYIQKLASPVIESKDPDIRISRANFDQMIATVSSQETLLKALEVAQPFVVAVDTFIGNSLETMGDLANQIAREAAANAYLHSADVLENKNNLEALQTKSIRSFSILNGVKAGEPEALAVLLKSDPALRKYVKEGVKVSSQNLDDMERELMARLQNTHLLLEQIKPRVDSYHAEILELEDMLQAVQESLRKMRIAVILWSRSHANLAAGVSVPPEIDIGGMLTGATSSAVKKVVP